MWDKTEEEKEPVTIADVVDVECAKPCLLSSADTDEKQKSIILNKKHEEWFWDKVLKPLIILIITMGGLIACAFYCVPCLMGIFVFSACTCPYIPAMNIPLWGTILILLIEGWSLTTGKMSLVWSG